MPAHEAPVEVIVKLVPEAVSSDSSGRRALQSCAARIGISLQPLHPFASDPELSTYFITHVDPAALSGVVEQLRHCEGVDGAYVKPRGEAP